MIMAFQTKEKARKDLIAALHPYDFTARPQIVRDSWNPSYYRVLKTFEAETGVGGILNTSFNLHGDAIVCTPEDAIYTLKQSALDALALGNYYITRK
jgi:carbamoyltransferase